MSPFVERRRESRLQTGTEANLRVLGRMAGPSQGLHMRVRVADISGSGMCVELPLPVPCGALVEISSEHSFLLGEVCRCAADGPGYRAGVRVSHVVSSLEELRRLNSVLQEEGYRVPASLSPRT